MSQPQILEHPPPLAEWAERLSNRNWIVERVGSVMIAVSPDRMVTIEIVGSMMVTTVEV